MLGFRSIFFLFTGLSYVDKIQLLVFDSYLFSVPSFKQGLGVVQNLSSLP